MFNNSNNKNNNSMLILMLFVTSIMNGSSADASATELPMEINEIYKPAWNNTGSPEHQNLKRRVADAVSIYSVFPGKNFRSRMKFRTANEVKLF